MPCDGRRSLSSRARPRADSQQHVEDRSSQGTYLLITVTLILPLMHAMQAAFSVARGVRAPCHADLRSGDRLQATAPKLKPNNRFCYDDRMFSHRRARRMVLAGARSELESTANQEWSHCAEGASETQLMSLYVYVHTSKQCFTKCSLYRRFGCHGVTRTLCQVRSRENPTRRQAPSTW